MKGKLRESALEKRCKISEKERVAKSHAIWESVLALDEVKKASEISCYIGIGSEVKTLGLVAGLLGKDKKVLVPAIKKAGSNMDMCSVLSLDELEKGRYFFEPRKECRRVSKPGNIDVMLVPGIAFDERGCRIGYGKGHYDRYLKKLKPRTPVIGLAYECQVMEEIPEEGHDVRVDKIITEQRVISCGISSKLDKIGRKFRK